MKFERKPIEPNPTCAMCGIAIKDHNESQMKYCMAERRNKKNPN